MGQERRVFQGIVVKNRGRGRSLGFPTANLQAPDDAPHGVFIGYATIEGRRMPSLIFIGAAETFGETNVHIEVYILHETIDLYGKTITVEILEKIRDGKKFPDEESLKAAIREDEAKASDYFAKN